MSNHFHSFHLVDQSPWPLLGSGGAGLLTLSTVVLIFNGLSLPLFISLVSMIMVASQWWRDISREATLQGHHSSAVELGMRWGMILFIISEVMFFFSFFWAYFHSSLAPTLELGMIWPPMMIEAFNPFTVPLLNTTILLTSGLSVTWAHHAMVEGDFNGTMYGSMSTVGLGVYFTMVQGYEYIESSFTMSDSCYGSCFFVATGFHGAHVLIGSVFLMVSLFRLMSGAFSTTHHFGFEAAAWYWHFVDVVWIFLFISIYWWGC